MQKIVEVVVVLEVVEVVVVLEVVELVGVLEVVEQRCSATIQELVVLLYC